MRLPLPEMFHPQAFSPRVAPLRIYFLATMARKNQILPKSFEEALAELEKILSEIEGGEVGLEESLLRYERGNFLIQHCRGVLNAAERQIEMLSKAPDGGIVSTPMATEPERGGPGQADADGIAES